MKRTVALLFLTLILAGLVGCALHESAAPLASNFNTEPATEDLSCSTVRQQDRGSFFVETADAYYYLSDQKVLFSQKDAPSFHLLCSKPNCAHTDENCNAYAGLALGCWKDKLYGVHQLGSELVLVQMNLDGSDHEQITKIEMPVDSSGQMGGAYSFVFLQEYLYYIVEAEPYALYRTCLEDGNTERLLQDALLNGTAVLEPLRVSGDALLLVLRELNGTEALYELEPETDSLTKLCDWPGGIPNWVAEQDVVFWYNPKDGAFYEYDIAENALVQKAAPNLGGGAAYYDEENIYLVCWGEIGTMSMDFYIYDRNYTLLDKLKLPFGYDYLYASRGDLFFTHSSTYKITEYLPRSEIGSGNLKLQPLN